MLTEQDYHKKAQQRLIEKLRPMEDWLRERGIAFCYVAQERHTRPRRGGGVIEHQHWRFAVAITGEPGERWAVPVMGACPQQMIDRIVAEHNQRLGLSSDDVARILASAADAPGPLAEALTGS